MLKTAHRDANEGDEEGSKENGHAVVLNDTTCCHYCIYR